ncbi:hypothetical protein L1987_50315 [Smallanthus sonchifolius]|uniref:Uncharacterized protein n=1 Tax=Smallanthus sonchifolius TaxID=185202 RepID=A0ACB9EMT3_9ASTR|nr:hypothetical protein L1987_50315 [Smallanthus sonchifolius]
MFDICLKKPWCLIRISYRKGRLDLFRALYKIFNTRKSTISLSPLFSRTTVHAPPHPPSHHQSPASALGFLLLRIFS